MVGQQATDRDGAEGNRAVETESGTEPVQHGQGGEEDAYGRQVEVVRVQPGSLIDPEVEEMAEWPPVYVRVVEGERRR